jgi:hypothetical protein
MQKYQWNLDEVSTARGDRTHPLPPDGTDLILNNPQSRGQS